MVGLLFSSQIRSKNSSMPVTFILHMAIFSLTICLVFKLCERTRQCQSLPQRQVKETVLQVHHSQLHRCAGRHCLLMPIILRRLFLPVYSMSSNDALFAFDILHQKRQHLYRWLLFKLLVERRIFKLLHSYHWSLFTGAHTVYMLFLND